MSKYKIENYDKDCKGLACAVKGCKGAVRYKCTTSAYHAMKDKFIDRVRYCCEGHGRTWATDKEAEEI